LIFDGGSIDQADIWDECLHIHYDSRWTA
jgi:hypothetical protein